MMLGLLWMAVANAACLLGTHALWRRCRTGLPSTDAALFLFLRFTIASSAVLLAGLAGCLNATALGLAGAATLAALLLGGEHRRIPRPDLRSLRSIPPGLLLVAGLFALRLLLQVWFLAPHAGDAISYHLPKVAEWVQAGRITGETGSAWRSHWPGGFQFFEIWWCVFLHHDLLIEMAGVETWAMAIAALFAIARWSGLDHRGAFLASLLFGAAPVVLMQAVACLSDLPVIALFLTATALVLARAHPLLLLLPLAVGVGVKPTLGFAAPGLCLLAWLLRNGPAAPRPILKVAAGLAILALGLGSYWYLRNWVLYGNPIHPASSAGFVDEQMVQQQVGPSWMSLKESVRRLIDSRMYDSLRGYNPQCEFAANWGPALFAAGLPGLLLALRDSARFRTLALAIAMSTGTVLLLVVSDPWFTRFVLFIPAVFSIAAARLAAIVRGVPVILAVCLGYQFIGSLATDRPGTLGEYPAMYRQSWRERASDLIGDTIPKGERSIASCGRGDYDYLLYGADLSRKVHYLRESTAEGIVEEMRRRGVSVIYATGGHVTLLDAGARRKLFRRMAGNFFCLPEWKPTSPSGRP